MERISLTIVKDEEVILGNPISIQICKVVE
jgi:hypothetical protein